MDALDLLAQDNYIIVNKTLIKEIGLENAIVLGVLCGYQRTLGNEFYKEQEKIIDDTGLTEYLVRKSIRELQEWGFIDVVKKGMPCKYYYSINLLKFKFLSSSGDEFDTTSGDEFDTTNIDINNNIEINNNKNKINKNNNNTRHKYGTYERILLTDAEYNRLVKDFGKDFISYMIEKLDEYIAMNGNKNGYKDFNLVLRKAIREKWFKTDNVSFNKPNTNMQLDLDAKPDTVNDNTESLQIRAERYFKNLYDTDIDKYYTELEKLKSKNKALADYVIKQVENCGFEVL